MSLPVLDHYPGRGLLVRRDPVGVIDWAYFITGRSASSRQRRVRVVGDTALIEPTGIGQNDPLRHYACARTTSEVLVLGNGDHVDVIATALARGDTLPVALEAVEPEPDPPIHTPRIGIVVGEAAANLFAVVRVADAIERRVTELPATPRSAALLTTYAGRLDEPVGSAPLRLFTDDRPFTTMLDELWSQLAPERRVLLLAGAGTSLDGCRAIHGEVK